MFLHGFFQNFQHDTLLKVDRSSQNLILFLQTFFRQGNVPTHRNCYRFEYKVAPNKRWTVHVRLTIRAGSTASGTACGGSTRCCGSEPPPRTPRARPIAPAPDASWTRSGTFCTTRSRTATRTRSRNCWTSNVRSGCHRGFRLFRRHFRTAGCNSRNCSSHWAHVARTGAFSASSLNPL